MKHFVFAFAAFAAMPTISASAATLNFTGTALGTCALLLPVDGTLTLGGDLQSWGTATPASITAVNTAPSTLTVTAPSSWGTSPAGTPATTFAVSGNMTGTNIGALGGSSLVRTGALTNIGLTTATVSLAGTATAPFRAGLHSAQVTVTCAAP